MSQSKATDESAQGERVAKILVIDDSAVHRSMYEDILRPAGYEVACAATGSEGLQTLERDVFDLVFLDYLLPDMDGLEVLRKIRLGKTPDLGVIMVTGHGTMDIAIDALRLRVQDFLTKPFKGEQLLATVQKALDATRVYRLLQRAQPRADQVQPDYLIGEDAAFREAVNLTARVAAAPQVTALILGETGTGKGLLARALHELSPRAGKPFQQVNCSGLPESLIELELYGAEAGAYTDSPGKRVGLVEQAEGGTLFLDEIGCLPLHLQPKLLDFLEQHNYRRVGASKPVTADVRIVAATNRDLAEAVHGGVFRSDLYFRINVVPIHLPPLRERGNDVLLLTTSFIDRFNREFGRNIQGLHPDAEAMLLCCAWPGNVRQLQNVIERAVLLSTEDTLTPDLLDGLGSQGALEDLTRFPTLREMERQHILKALDVAQGNRTRAATLLGISRETLRAKVQE